MYDFDFQWAQLVARAWSDPAFKAKLLADPAGVMRENGLTPPAGVRFEVTEDTNEVRHLVLPARPEVEELSAEELEHVPGGVVMPGFYPRHHHCHGHCYHPHCHGHCYHPHCHGHCYVHGRTVAQGA